MTNGGNPNDEIRTERSDIPTTNYGPWRSCGRFVISVLPLVVSVILDAAIAGRALSSEAMELGLQPTFGASFSLLPSVKWSF
jgi:hypothetical protein